MKHEKSTVLNYWALWCLTSSLQSYATTRGGLLMGPAFGGKWGCDLIWYAGLELCAGVTCIYWIGPWLPCPPALDQIVANLAPHTRSGPNRASPMYWFRFQPCTLEWIPDLIWPVDQTYTTQLVAGLEGWAPLTQFINRASGFPLKIITEGSQISFDVHLRKIQNIIKELLCRKV